ncbi:tetratricopeptide repeat protein [Diplocloster hominis]|uniref:tetratricopeptide repeat protein n=1 Tax=Diplocloster hominis TaxID=3079010 RepID=UPI0031BB3420
MRCLYCGSTLSDVDYCTNCGADVSVYKKIIRLSNALYNDGLEKAKVRDLSGAVTSLNLALKYNKNHVQARNLLGLIYYEMGEAVAALSQWVISKNIQSKKNPADYFLNDLQENQGRLETMNTTIKKFNQALLYCEQSSDDLAVIQLKKVLSMNPKLVKAYQLLALCYMKNEDYGKAEGMLRRAGKIDRANTLTLHLVKELNAFKGVNPKPEEPKNEDSVAYRSGNETIIQPKTFKDNSGMSTVINIIIGLLVGAALMWFLVLPARMQAEKGNSNQSEIEFNEQLSTKNANIKQLETDLATAKSNEEEAKQQAQAQDVKVTSYEQLLAAYAAYSAQDTVTAADALQKVDAASLSGDAKTLYDAIQTDVNTKAAEELYTTGYSAYKKGDFAAAIQDLGQAVELNADVHNGDALFYLARSYDRSGDQANADKFYQQVYDKYPNTNKARQSASYMSTPPVEGANAGGENAAGNAAGDNQTNDNTDQQPPQDTGEEPPDNTQE